MVENARNENEVEIICHLVRSISRRINSMHIFCILALITFGMGDALTAAKMMETIGVNAEYNTFISTIYADYGLLPFMAIKVSLTALLIISSLLIYWQSKGRSYWMINGFLISLTIGGIMATMANVQATAGLPFISPMKFNFLFLGLVLILVEAGDFIDNNKFAATI
jgi:general stress protein CsbA